ncbi:sensor domain-containing diguanylate cyclase [Vibrio sp. SCSIO 43137]|uniref:sensor domain-containing diguanylate cyclase n=1 Tax=Vibrio sp. SCSIO 43137 TaxID=3021011 RepID=UPI002306E531|nr:diguanylate cyclase [Vibrio sp. SCSIO 43137]WCE28816.1 diguanylate cyclase [Vibrio sp. SCSIO 43137]
MTSPKAETGAISADYQRLKSFVDSSLAGVLILDSKQKVILMNPTACQMFQLSGENLSDLTLDALLPKRFRSIHSDHVKTFGSSSKQAKRMNRLNIVTGLKQDGREFPLEVSISKIFVAGQTEYCALLRDISDDMPLLKELVKEASEDYLTGLSNRKTFEHRLLLETHRSTRHSLPLSVAVIDLDHFKTVNDTLGHNVGDTVLRQMAELLRENIRDIDLVSRWGGDEFVALLVDTDLIGISIWAERVRNRVENHTFGDKENPIRLTISIGISCTEGDKTRAESLFEHADNCLFEAKQGGRNQVVAKKNR